MARPRDLARRERAAMTRLPVGLVLCAIAAAAVAAWVFWPLSRTGPDEARKAALGEVIYRQHCANCHGADLEGQPDWRARKPDGRLPAPPHDATGHTWHHTDEQLFRITKHGLTPPLAPEGYQSDMPGFGAVLSDEEIRAVLAYIKRSWPPEILARQPSPKHDPR